MRLIPPRPDADISFATSTGHFICLPHSNQPSLDSILRSVLPFVRKSFLFQRHTTFSMKRTIRSQGQGCGSLIGRQIDCYSVLSLLGVGGMGEVYRALDTRLDRIVALKILPQTFACDKSRMRRFVRESKAASSFNHPNICTIYDIGESEGINCIVRSWGTRRRGRQHSLSPGPSIGGLIVRSACSPRDE
jgi:serine/threonine protein kinase